MDSIISMLADDMLQIDALASCMEDDRALARIIDSEESLALFIARVSDKSTLASLKGILATLRTRDEMLSEVCGVWDRGLIATIGRLERQVQSLTWNIQESIKDYRGAKRDKDAYMLRPVGLHTIFHPVGVDSSRLYPKSSADVDSVRSSVGGRRRMLPENIQVICMELINTLCELVGSRVWWDLVLRSRRCKVRKSNKRKHMSPSARRRKARRANRAMCRRTAAEVRLSKLI